MTFSYSFFLRIYCFIEINYCICPQSKILYCKYKIKIENSFIGSESTIQVFTIIHQLGASSGDCHVFHPMVRNFLF